MAILYSKSIVFGRINSQRLKCNENRRAGHRRPLKSRGFSATQAWQRVDGGDQVRVRSNSNSSSNGSTCSSPDVLRRIFEMRSQASAQESPRFFVCEEKRRFFGTESPQKWLPGHCISLRRPDVGYRTRSLNRTSASSKSARRRHRSSASLAKFQRPSRSPSSRRACTSSRLGRRSKHTSKRCFRPPNRKRRFDGSLGPRRGLSRLLRASQC